MIAIIKYFANSSQLPQDLNKIFGYDRDVPQRW